MSRLGCSYFSSFVYRKQTWNHVSIEQNSDVWVMPILHAGNALLTEPVHTKHFWRFLVCLFLLKTTYGTYIESGTKIRIAYKLCCNSGKFVPDSRNPGENLHSVGSRCSKFLGLFRFHRVPQWLHLHYRLFGGVGFFFQLIQFIVDCFINVFCFNYCVSHFYWSFYYSLLISRVKFLVFSSLPLGYVHFLSLFISFIVLFNSSSCLFNFSFNIQFILYECVGHPYSWISNYCVDREIENKTMCHRALKDRCGILNIPITSPNDSVRTAEKIFAF